MRYNVHDKAEYWNQGYSMAVKWEARGDCAIVTIHGRIDKDEVISTIDEISGDTLYRHVIWDISNAVAPMGLPVHLKEINEHSAQFWDARGTGAKTAVVTQNELDRRNLSPWISGTAWHTGIQMQIFANMSDAFEWIESD